MLPVVYLFDLLSGATPLRKNKKPTRWQETAQGRFHHPTFRLHIIECLYRSKETYGKAGDEKVFGYG